MKYQAMSETVLKAVGGKENITSVTHCATRLRIDARDTSIIDLQLAKSADQALGAVVSGGQLQVIIGPNVTEAYNDFLDFAGNRSRRWHGCRRCPNRQRPCRRH